MSLLKRFPHFFQLDSMDCGPACLRMIAKYYGRTYSLQTLRSKSFITREGVSMLGISDAAESIGFRTSGVRVNFDQLANHMPLPCILHWRQNHFVVCYGVEKKRMSLLGGKGNVDYTVHIADPSHGLISYSKEELLKNWGDSKDKKGETGSVLVLQPTPDFYSYADEGEKKEHSFSYFFKYLRPFKSQLIQLIIGMIIGMILQLILPFLTQSMVDTGINSGNLNFVTLVLIAQLIIFTTQLAVDFIRSWLVLHMNTRISIFLISDFLAKLMRLPVGFFDTKMVGDIMQRIGDHGRVQSFMTGSSINIVFSVANFIVFSFILAYFNTTILLIFFIGNMLYVLWILSFMKYRRELDYKRFAQAAKEQSNLFQLVTGMQEIKLNNCEKQKRWQWEDIQVKLFRISIRGLALGQYQQLGSVFLSQATNIIISYIAVKSVIDGSMTLGMMMSQSYIIGQLSSPIGQFIGFAQNLQDAKISLERLGEIHNKEDETMSGDIQLTELPENKNINIKDLWFSYDGADRDYALENINLSIPHNKITALVGASGSGKTTLVKLLLGFYSLNKGEIQVGEVSLKNINPYTWRKSTGAVMQDGFIFSDTIANNIAVGVETIEKERLIHAVNTANIREFIDSLPLGYNTVIGMEGKGISQGQRQRILIARAIYKNPDFLFFDEATNALDLKNESEILSNLNSFYKSKTVVIVAHRLTTVQHADNIIVLEKGRIAEQGTHKELSEARGIYYQLIKNQLELGC